MIYDTIVIGAGPAGLTAGLYAARANLKVLAVEKGLPGGELNNTESIEDYPGVGRIGGADLAAAFLRDASSFGLEIEYAEVASVEKGQGGIFGVKLADGRLLAARTVIATTGGLPKKLGVPGEDVFTGRGVSYCGVCDAPLYRGKRIVSAGGGDAAADETLYLSRFAEHVTLLVRGEKFRASPRTVEELLRTPNITVRMQTSITSIEGDGSGVTHVCMRDNKTGDGLPPLAADGIFVFIGFTPNTAPLSALAHLEHDENGCIRTSRDMETRVPGLFVAGDLRSQLTRQVTTAVGDGTTAAVAAYHYLQEQGRREMP